MSIPEFLQELWCGGLKLAATLHNRVVELSSSDFTISRSTDAGTPRLLLSLNPLLTQGIDETDDRVTALENARQATVVAYDTTISLDFASLSDSVIISLPENLPDTTISAPTNTVNGRIYTVVMPHEAGGVVSAGLVWNAAWKFNGTDAGGTITGDPNYLYAWNFVAYEGLMIQLGGFGLEAL